MNENFKLLKKLCSLPGIAGNEDRVRDLIISEISSHVENITVDNLGNIIAFKKGKSCANTKLMVCAHMDEVGLIITHVTSDGYLGFAAVGGIDTKILHGITVNIGKNAVKGVIGIRPIHLTSGDEKNKPVKIENLLIDIGANSKEEALEHVNIGDFVTFEFLYEDLKNSIISKALDDRAGCNILISIIKGEVEFDTYFVFTVQEEIGLVGAKTSAYSVRPDAAIIVETTTASDLPDSDESKKVCRLGAGTVISFMDKGTIYDKSLYDLSIATAREKDIAFQIKQGIYGGNDAGAIHASREGVRTIALSIPCRYLHSPAGIIYKSDYVATCCLASALIEKINNMK